GGTVSLGNANNFGILSGLACYLLTLKPKGIREPHWHPNAAELDYVIAGRGRMTIFSPGDHVDTFEVGPGEIVFIPSAYFHYIENVNSNEDMQFAVFLTMNDQKISAFQEPLVRIQMTSWDLFSI